ncbi:MAG: hypothetical protein RL033_7771 [Pseudomonadota bacterium]|jgi:hypothetical protein
MRVVQAQPRSRSAVLCWLAMGCSAIACLDRPIGSPEPITTNVFTARISRDSVERIDLLFMIDNSASMSDKQLILETAVPDLVDRLANPVCIDAQGGQHPAAPPGQRCPEGQRREFRAVTDIHVGIVSSSLGDAGAQDGCVGDDKQDDAHLVGSLPRASSARSNQWGFLSWDESTEPQLFQRDFRALVRSVGESGCGYEASLESWYRFLADPAPYAAYDKEPCAAGSNSQCTVPRRGPDGQPLLDETLLAQRRAFLRPDSLLAIVLLSDENDCSFRAIGQSWRVASSAVPMYASSAACADNPNDRCCYSCGAVMPPAGCEWAESTCVAGDSHPADYLPAAADAANLRCFDQKRRFGVDLLYPAERYVNALRALRLCPSNPSLGVEGCPGAVVDNPLFSGGRTPESVYLAGIIGVPWQAIASDRDRLGNALAEDVLRFKTAAELGPIDWRNILGEPGASPPLPPALPLMRESTAARPGVNAGGPNGREYATDLRVAGMPEDLQYACIFPLPESRQCAGESDLSCDCAAGSEDKPLCEATPGATPSTVQHWAKAYPGLRELEVLRGFGENSIVASICARNVQDLERRDFGYRPAISSILERLEEQLVRRCLPRALEVSADGSVPCTLVEVRPDSPSCNCDPARARSKPGALLETGVRESLARALDKPCGAADPECSRACLCEVEQVVAASALDACRNQDNPAGVEGWCYVADDDEQHIGNPALVAECRPNERRVLRLVGEGQQDGLTVISCSGRSFAREPQP